jgi:peptidoglycan/xylan/chitin deacetylase (PgdA/CDA1 family)
LRTLAKRTLFSASRHCGVNAALRARHRQRLLVLIYHSVVSDDCARDPYRYGSVCGVTKFREQMEIVARVLRPVSAAQVEAAFAGRSILPANPVLITFDDGYRNNLTYAAPILRRMGIPAVVHVTTGYVGGRRILWPNEVYRRVLHWPQATLPMPDLRSERRLGPTSAERVAAAGEVRDAAKNVSDIQRQAYLARLREQDMPDAQPEDELFGFLSWDEVRELHRHGFAVGSHTVEHPILTRLEPAQLAAQLRESRETIERQIGEPCTVFAYPNGGPEDVSPEVVESVRAAGYRIAFTGFPGLCSTGDDPLLLNRVGVPAQLPTDAFHARISGLQALLQGLRRKLEGVTSRRPAARVETVRG